MEISKISVVRSIDPDRALQGVASVELNNAIRINDIRIIKLEITTWFLCLQRN